MDTKLLSAMISRGVPPEHVVVVAEIVDAWFAEITEKRRAEWRRRKAAHRDKKEGEPAELTEPTEKPVDIPRNVTQRM